MNLFYIILIFLIVLLMSVIIFFYTKQIRGTILSFVVACFFIFILILRHTDIVYSLNKGSSIDIIDVALSLFLIGSSFKDYIKTKRFRKLFYPLLCCYVLLGIPIMESSKINNKMIMMYIIFGGAITLFYCIWDIRHAPQRQRGTQEN